MMGRFGDASVIRMFSIFSINDLIPKNVHFFLIRLSNTKILDPVKMLALYKDCNKVMFMTSTCIITFLDDKLFPDPLLLFLELLVEGMGGTTTVDFEILEVAQPFQMVEGLEAKM